MKTNIESKKRKSYSSPQIEHIKLDNNISLALESFVPDGEPNWMKTQESYNNDPFNTLTNKI